MPTSARLGLPGADCHAHVFCPGLPYHPEAAYLPEPSQEAGTVRHFLAVLDAHGLTHGLLVAALPYGHDSRCLVEALAEGGGRLRGIALVPPSAEAALLQRLAEAGVVGARVNLSAHGLRELADPASERLFAAMRELGWVLQVHSVADELAEAAPLLRRTGLRLVFDHFGRPDPRRGADQPGFRSLLEFGRTGRHAVKLSGAFRLSSAGPPYADTDLYVGAAIGAFGIENCVWGSDWPFVLTGERVDYGPSLACLDRWVADAAARRRVLWDTPRRLFGFQDL